MHIIWYLSKRSTFQNFGIKIEQRIKNDMYIVWECYVYFLKNCNKNTETFTIDVIKINTIIFLSWPLTFVKCDLIHRTFIKKKKNRYVRVITNFTI